MRETEIDSDASRLFLRQPIWIGAGQRFDQRALPVVHVSGGGKDVMRRRHSNSKNTLCTISVLPTTLIVALSNALIIHLLSWHGSRGLLLRPVVGKSYVGRV